MKAVVCRQWCEPEGLTFEDLPDPAPGPGEVLIAVEHTGLSFATRLVIAGKYQRKPPLPFSPGTEVVGRVAAIGAGVGQVSPGQRVMAVLDWGGHAELALATAETVYPLPDDLDPVVAPHVPLSYGTSYAALHWRARLAPGETLLVHGATGAVGLAAVELGRIQGARVIATASSEDKRRLALAHGAEVALDPRDPDLRERIRDLTEGRGADVIFDPIGGDLFDLSLRCIANEGRLLTIGYASGRIPQAPANILLVKNIAVVGLNVGVYVGWGLIDERKRYEAQMRAMVGHLVRLWQAGAIRPTVSHRFPLARYLDGYRVIADRRSVGKVVFDIGG